MSALSMTHEEIQSAVPNTIRVMVVDDSAVIRGVLTRWLEDDASIKVTASAANGVIALRLARSQQFDVIVLDIEMPEMDGLTALPQLLEVQPGVQILMASTLTARNANISLQALRLGAADYIPKPQSTRIVGEGVDFKRELIDKVLALGPVARRRRGQHSVTAAQETKAPIASPMTATVAAPPLRKLTTGPVVLAQSSKMKPAILAVGSSTGGPQALFTYLGSLPKPFPLPILITQHMPATFTAILAQHIERLTGLPTAEAKADERLIEGRVYVAPGNLHMIVQGQSGNITLGLTETPPENFCRPAVDPLFRSVAQIYGNRSLAVVLTGMGQDGMLGAKDIIGAGGTVIAQDEASSVVWGMPGAVAHAGLASFILPLPEIGKKTVSLIEGRHL